MKLKRRQTGARTPGLWRAAGACCAAAALLAVAAASAAQSTVAPTGQGAPAANAAPAQTAAPNAEKEVRRPRNADRRKAAKLYLSASKLFVDSQFEAAMKDYEAAAQLDPGNNDYRMAAEVARSHAATALVQAAAKDRLLGNDAAARAALSRALELDPRNIEATEHMDELADDAAREQPKELYRTSAAESSQPIVLTPDPGLRSFHLRNDQRQVIERVFEAYGVMAMLDDSVRSTVVRLDIDDVDFETAARVLGMLTNSFWVPLDGRRAVVASDNRENRQKFMRQDLETVYLSGLSDDELKEVENIAKNAFEVQQVSSSPSARTITLRAPPDTLSAFNATMRSLLDGKSQVVLDVRMIQVAHNTNRNTGAQFPQSITAFNVYAEEESLLSQNQSLVQQIISSGLASPNDPLAILGILIASGQVSSSLLSNGFALFGGGLTQSALTTGSTTLNLNLNSSDSRELDQIQLRLQDGEKGTLKDGERYPIQTSSYSSLSGSIPNIPGLTGAGVSSSLSSLLSSLTSSVPNIPMVQYQDLGLTLSATPSVMRNDTVGLSIEMSLTALSGTTIDGNPVLDNRAYNSLVTLKEGEAAVVATEVDKSESMAISGTPGISEIPGLNNVTGKDLQQDYATIVIIMTPHVVRGLQAAGHTAMMRVEKNEGQ